MVVLFYVLTSKTTDFMLLQKQEKQQDAV